MIHIVIHAGYVKCKSLMDRHRIRNSIEATVRFAVELGYEVTMVKDATADYSDEEMRASLDVNIPHYASAIVTTTEIVESISSL